ncbi:MAG: arginase family protein [Candidatus Pacearchaeota archaeon]|jgi:agmatinase
MKLYFVPGINGLGKTSGVEKNDLFFKNFEFEKLKLNNEDINKQFKEIYSFFGKSLMKNFFVLGGDHSISYPIFKSFFEKYKQDAKLLIFDAHFDLVKPMPEPTHEEWLRAIIELGFNPKNILLVGIRRKSKNIDIKEINYAFEKKINIVYCDEFKEKLNEILNFASNGKTYVSFDIDAFDSSIISCTSYPEKQGLFEEDVFSLLNKLCKLKSVYAFDLVEINFNKCSKKDKEKTLKVAKKFLKIFLNKI